MGKIRHDVENHHLVRYPEDRAACEPFLHAFDVTRAVRDGAHTFFLLKSVDDAFARFLGVEGDREILLLYSLGTALEQRDFQCLNDPPQQLGPTRRLEPRLRLMVSNDQQTARLVERHLNEYPDERPIVGFDLAGLSEVTSAGDLYRLVKERHHVRDFFSLHAPLTEEAMFFGRKDVLGDLKDRIRAGQNSGIFGLRRIGKTSILFALQRDLSSQREAASLYLDLQGAYRMRWWDLLAYVVKRVAETSGLGKTAKSKLLALQDDGYQESSASQDFFSDIGEILKRVTGSRLVLLLDEIEYITTEISPAPHWSSDYLPFWGSMRAAHQNTAGSFTYVLAGVNPYAIELQEVEGVDNPLFHTTRAMYVGPLDESSANRMVRTLARMMGLNVDRDFLRGLHQRFGGHPYLARQACSSLARKLDDRPATLSGQLLEAESAYVAAETREPAEQILSVLKKWYPYEYDLLQELALGDVEVFKEFATDDASFASHVIGYGLVAEPTTTPYIVIGVAATVLRDGVSSPSILPIPDAESESLDSDEDWEQVILEVSLRRNRIERTLRDITREGLRFRYGQKSLDQALKSVAGARGPRLMQNGYESFWDHLFFSELSDIILANWGAFETSFSVSKADFDRWMDHINRCRVDAHAKTSPPTT